MKIVINCGQKIIGSLGKNIAKEAAFAGVAAVFGITSKVATEVVSTLVIDAIKKNKEKKKNVPDYVNFVVGEDA